MNKYTLNRFYFEARAIIEKYDFHRPDYELRVSFEIKERKNKVFGLNCVICYSHHKHDRDNESFYGFGVTPAICLSSFEETLREKSGMALVENIEVEYSSVNEEEL